MGKPVRYINLKRKQLNKGKQSLFLKRKGDING